ncbi:MAG: helix-turn-helix domain-containing protein [Burkholderiaceae bacterium]|nr:helix-turn-helix domain-containing protein [Burkholderiaceae bacterium]
MQPVNDPQLCDQVFQHVLVKSGQQVHATGQQFEMLYLVNSGFLKTIALSDAGQEVVLKFPMRGDLLGVDGIDGQRYASESIALSDCDLIMLPFHKLTTLGRECGDLENLIYCAISRELVHRQMQIGMFSGLCAEARVARFLAALAERFGQLGYSSKSFNLRMSRQEMGSYLGLTLETVSRTLSALSAMGVINVNRRTVDIIDAVCLKTMRRIPPSFLNARNEMRACLH